MNKTIIKIEKLSKKYMIGEKHSYSLYESTIGLFKKKKPKDVFWALKNINLEVKEGQVLGIIGPNGAGKSTLLKILSRITPPTKGKVTINGHVSSLLEVGTGFHPELTGRENVYLNGAILGMKRGEIKRKFKEIVEFAEIGKFLDTPVKHYSSGMYVRLAFAIAAHLEPEILIVDEVLSVGDASFQQKSLGRMKEVSKAGRTVLFVSHSLGTIRQLCDSCILIKKGKIVASGKPKNVIEAYLGESSVEAPIYVQDHDGKKSMNLRRVLLNPHQKKPKVDISYDEDIVLRIEYEINKSIIDSSIWFLIQTTDGGNVFRSADFDTDLKRRGRRETGYYSSDIIIPGKWLNLGQYMVVVGLNRDNPLEIYDRKETIVFNIIDNGGTPNSIFKEARPGLLQPFLKWEISKINGKTKHN